MDSQHLLVPIKVQALVIDDIVIKRSGVVKNPGHKYRGQRGRWSPKLYDYQPLLSTSASAWSKTVLWRKARLTAVNR